jgi:SOS-response transcriptional repressor LexA
MTEPVRPTKKQKELLQFIQAFIDEHGYSPSYREIMNGLNYTSVATVALHVNSLIKRGHLVKREHAARSLEVVVHEESAPSANFMGAEEKWLVARVDGLFKEIESKTSLAMAEIDHLYVLVGALKVIGLEEAAKKFMPRLLTLKETAAKEVA